METPPKTLEYTFDLDPALDEQNMYEETCQESIQMMMDVGVDPTDEFIQDCQGRLHQALVAGHNALREAIAYMNDPERKEGGDINLSAGEWEDVAARLEDDQHKNDPGADRLAKKIRLDMHPEDASTLHFAPGDYQYIDGVCEGLGFSL